MDTIDYLSTLSVTPRWLRAAANRRALSNFLSVKVSTLKKLVSTISESLPPEAGFMPPEIITRILKHPDFPEVLNKFGTATDPTALESSYSNLASTVASLCAGGTTTEEGVRISPVMVMGTYPKIMVLENGAAKVTATVQFLNEVIGLPMRDVSMCLERHPALFGVKITDLKRGAAYMTEIEIGDAGPDGEENPLAKVVRAFPHLLTLRVPQMAKVVNFLRSIGVVNVGRFVTRVPPILGSDVDHDLLPKWEELDRLGITTYNLVRFPAYFSYPLPRILSRYSYLDSKGIPATSRPLDEVLRGSDLDFARELCGEETEGSFVEFAKRMEKEGKEAAESAAPPTPQAVPAAAPGGE